MANDQMHFDEPKPTKPSRRTQAPPQAPPLTPSQTPPPLVPIEAAPSQPSASIPEGEQPTAPAQPTAQAGVACLCAAINPKPEFPSAKNRAAKLAAQTRRAGTATDTPSDTHSTLTADDFAVALGKPHAEPDQTRPADQTVTAAFAQAWAEDGDVLRYRGDDYREADTPPGMDSPAAAGWQPTAQVKLPVADRTYARKENEQANQLFEAYGASYSEAYAAALANAFSEDKPLPDDDTGDVTGLVSSIMHPPGGEPILLGSVYLEDRPDGDADATAANIAGEPTLSPGRKLTRGLLLALGAATVALACLYFTGQL